MVMLGALVWAAIATLVAGVAIYFAVHWHDGARRAHERANAWRAAVMRGTSRIEALEAAQAVDDDSDPEHFV